MSTPRTGKAGLSAVALAALSMLSVSPVLADEFFVGGAWSALDDGGRVSTDILSPPTDPSEDMPVSFTAGVDAVADTDLTIGYTLPALGIFTLDIDNTATDWAEPANPALAQTEESFGSYAASFMGGQFGVFGGMKDEQSAFAMELTTSRTLGASVGYAGFYLRGAYQDSGPDGLLDGRRAWQAGLGYGSGDFDVRVTYVESSFVQGSPTELEGKQWMVGGLVQVTPSLLLNANAFIVDRELTMPTVEPPGTGARLGLQLRF